MGLFTQLKNLLESIQIEPIYARARKAALEKSSLSTSEIPQACPYRAEQILDEDFLPPLH